MAGHADGTEPAIRCVACDQLPTTITTVWPAWRRGCPWPPRSARPRSSPGAAGTPRQVRQGAHRPAIPQAAIGSPPKTFCDDHRTVFATAGGRIQLTAGILAAAQVVLASLRAPYLDRGYGPAAIATAQETVDKEHCR
jgi:hypothetical protein